MNVKIEFELPDWAHGRHIYIMAGVELLATLEFRSEKKRNHDNTITRKKYYLPLKLKPLDGRCNGCGDCCNNGGSFISKPLLEKVKKRLLNYTHSKKDRCPMLGNDGCILGSAIPFSCIRSNCEGWSENCKEKLIELEVL